MIIPIIAGATATGKTKISIELAKKINGEIISADSMQVYKYMDIATAKATKEEMQGIKHYLIDVAEPVDNFTVVDWIDKTKEAINEIIKKGKTPIIVGGTGLYINTLMYGINHIKYSKEQEELQEKTRTKYMDISVTEKGKKQIYEKAKQIDPKATESLSINDVKRLVRIIEIYEVTGKIKTELEKENRKETKYTYKLFVLDLPREMLYKRINNRVDEMVEQGLIEEAKMLFKKYKNKDITKINSFKAIGYIEIYKYLTNEITKKEAIDKIKQNTRRYAKRQYTWFRKNKPEWIDVTSLHDSNLNKEQLDEKVMNIAKNIEESIK